MQSHTRNGRVPGRAFAVLAAVLLASASAHAAIIGGNLTGGTAVTAGGSFVELTPPVPNPFGPPNSVGNNNFQSPNLFGFDEDQNILLGADLFFDVGGSVAAGTIVASHYVFFDPGPTQRAIGTVNFDSAVLGVITSTSLLAASDFLANTGVNYLNPTLRGLEGGDVVTISGLQQISVDFTASSPGDYVRVITAFSPGGEPPPTPSPEPATFLLFGVAMTGGARRLRRLKA